MKWDQFHISYIFGVAGLISATLGLIAKAIDKTIGFSGDFWMLLALFLVVFAICTKVDDIRSRGKKA